MCVFLNRVPRYARGAVIAMSFAPARFCAASLLLAASATHASPAHYYFRPGVEPVGSGGYRSDRIELRLRPIAAAAARASLRLGASLSAAGAKRPQVASLGVTSIDRVAAAVGAAAFPPGLAGGTKAAAGVRPGGFTPLRPTAARPGAPGARARPPAHARV